MSGCKRIRLGLIGDNIRASRSPDLHRIAGEQLGLDVSYDLYIPPDLGLGFDQTFDKCRADGLRGFNVTLPYKEKVLARVTVADPVIARIGAVNTVRLTADGAEGFNTDYSGFQAAYRAACGDVAPGVVLLIGGGGVGKAIAFALIALGASEIRIVDKDAAKAAALAGALEQAGGRAVVFADAALAMQGAEGVINCTPLGMVGYPGSPLRDEDFCGQRWAFDAVYTPTDTPFRAQAIAAGAQFISGYELFFNQGIDAFEILTGHRPARLAELRQRLAAPQAR